MSAVFSGGYARESGRCERCLHFRVSLVEERAPFWVWAVDPFIRWTRTVCSWGSKYTCVRASVIKTTSIISCPFEWTRQAYLLSSSVYLYWSVLISVFNLLNPLHSTRFNFSLDDIDLLELIYSNTKIPKKRNTLYPILSIKILYTWN